MLGICGATILTKATAPKSQTDAAVPPGQEMWLVARDALPRFLTEAALHCVGGPIGGADKICTKIHGNLDKHRTSEALYGSFLTVSSNGRLREHPRVAR